MRCKFISDARCKNKATDKYQGIAVCAEHKHYLEERVNIVLGGKKAAQRSLHWTGLRRCPFCNALLEEQSVYCDTCGSDTPRQ